MLVSWGVVHYWYPVTELALDWNCTGSHKLPAWLPRRQSTLHSDSVITRVVLGKDQLYLSVWKYEL